MNDLYFVREHLPPLPARVLEIGCGKGELARTLSRSGYDVIAVDPRAPKGRIFRRIKIANFVDPVLFDAAIAVTSLHHVDDLPGTLDKVWALLRPGGVLIVDEFVWDRFRHLPTSRWYFHQRQAAAAIGKHRNRLLRGSFENWHKWWLAEHRDLHPFREMEAELNRRFRRRFFGWTPYLYAYDLDESLKPVEQELIASGAIQPTGFRWVGQRMKRRKTYIRTQHRSRKRDGSAG